MRSLVLDGQVVSGRGNGRKYLQLPWVKKQIEEKLGFTPYPGTLNLTLSKESTQRKRLLGKAKSIEICPAEGYCVGILFEATINGSSCGIVVPQVAGYPENILEIIAPIYLRDALALKDDDAVSVTVRF